MDEQRFDDLTRALGRGITRRGFLGSLGAAAGAMLATTGSALAACRKGGGVCRKNGDCCTGSCLDKDSTGRGRCSCEGGAVLCRGKCVDPAVKFASDPKNCGGCGIVCPNTACGTGICVNGSCGVTAKQNNVGQPCVSGDLCTVNDVCQADGTCLGTPISCTVDDGRCASAACDPSTGQCVTTNFTQGTSCSDGLGCNGKEACDGNGACVEGEPIECSLLVVDDRCGSAICDTQTGKCQLTLSPVGTVCGSTDPCIGRQTCNADGICVQEDPILCSDQASACQSATCNPTTESCDLAFEPAGTVCGEGDLCTGIPTCDGAGTCNAATAKDCSALESDCATVTCNPETGVCEVDKKPVGTICKAATACQAASTCDSSGLCRAGAGIDCSTLSTSCQTASCDENTGQCVFTNIQNGTACDFGLNCITGGVCQNGVCSSQPRECFTPVPNDRCARAYCDETTGQCVVENYPAGTICGDNVTCNGVETCDGTGVCRAVANSGTDCSVLSTECQTFFCDTQLGQCSSINRPDRTFCDNGEGVCLAGVCKRGGNDFVCTGGQECVSGSCVASTCLTGGNGIACLTDWDCTNACVAGLCSDGELGSPCDTDGDCIHGWECTNRICSVPTYPNGAACTSPDQCDSGACGRIITAADQAISPVCCVASGDSCFVSSDCCSPQGSPHVCINGVCQPSAAGTACTASIDCPAGLYCELRSHTCEYVGVFGDYCDSSTPCASNLRCCSGICKVCCQPNNTLVPSFSGCGPTNKNICCDGQCSSLTDTNCGCGVDCTKGVGCNGTTQTATCTSKGVCTYNGIKSCRTGGWCYPDCWSDGTCSGGNLFVFDYSEQCTSDFVVIIEGEGKVCYSNEDCPSNQTCQASSSCGGGAGTVFCQEGGGSCV